jgi:gamma-glutamyl-gamma-aminobutyrate hydrolase PuuD
MIIFTQSVVYSHLLAVREHVAGYGARAHVIDTLIPVPDLLERIDYGMMEESRKKALFLIPHYGIAKDRLRKEFPGLAQYLDNLVRTREGKTGRLMKNARAIILNGNDHISVNPSLHGYESDDVYWLIFYKGNWYLDAQLEIDSFLAKYAFNNQLPVFGICRGYQLLHRLFGGTGKVIVSDTERNTHVDRRYFENGFNEYGEGRVEMFPSGTHDVLIKEDSIMHYCLGSDIICPVSLHYEIICDSKLHENEIITARSFEGDGLNYPEAIEFSNHRACIGVQFHPEFGEGRILLERFINYVYDIEAAPEITMLEWACQKYGRFSRIGTCA